MSNLSHPLRWGLHKGKLLEEVPEKYLQWLSSRDPLSFTAKIAGEPAPLMAKDELARRGNKNLISPRPTNFPGLPVLEEPNQIRLRPDVVTCVSVQSMDTAVRLLLKEFLVRSSKDLTLSQWLIDLAKEAVRYGESYTSEPNMYIYMDLEFLIDPGKGLFVQLKERER